MRYNYYNKQFIVSDFVIIGKGGTYDKYFFACDNIKSVFKKQKDPKTSPLRTHRMHRLRGRLKKFYLN